MIRFRDYAGAYPFAALARDRDGVLTMRLHRDGGAFVFDQRVQDSLTRLFRDMAGDPENRAVIITGTGDVFSTAVDEVELAELIAGFSPATAATWRRNGRSTVAAMLEIDAPVIWCWNGPVTAHPELWFGGADLILADPNAWVCDETHLLGGMMAGGDAPSVWESLLGLPRARAFQLTGMTLGAAQLHEWGVVLEIVSRDEQEARARELLQPLLSATPLTLGYSRAALNARLRRFVESETPATYGLLGLAAVERFGTRGTRETEKEPN